MSRFSDPAAQQGGPLFARLPAELRLNIYAFVLEGIPRVIPGARNTTGNGRRISLLATCQQLYTECAAELYNRTTFEVVIRSDHFLCVGRLWYDDRDDEEANLFHIYSILRHARRINLLIFIRHIPSRIDVIWFTSGDMAPHALTERLLVVADLTRHVPLLTHLDISLLENRQSTAFIHRNHVREVLRPFDTLRNLTEVRVTASCLTPVISTFSLAAIRAASTLPAPYTLETFGPPQGFTIHGTNSYVQDFIRLLQGNSPPLPFPLRWAWYMLHHCLDADRSLGFEILSNINPRHGLSGRQLVDRCWEVALLGDRAEFQSCAERLVIALCREGQAESPDIVDRRERRRGEVFFDHLKDYWRRLTAGRLW